jgi:hypothetical protein
LQVGFSYLTRYLVTHSVASNGAHYSKKCFIAEAWFAMRSTGILAD